MLGAVFALYARTRKGGELRLLSAGLVVAALLYLGLALGSADPKWLILEASGVLVFGPLAWIGRSNAWWLALGWTAHVAWDVGLHLDRPQPLVGAWYPLLCVGFDLMVAGFVLRAAAPTSAMAPGPSRS